MSIERIILIAYDNLPPEQRDGSFPTIIRRYGHQYKLASHKDDVARYELIADELANELQTELATQAAALEAQSATIAELRLKVQHQQEGLDSYIKRLQDANEKAAHHAELVRIASATAQRYEAAIEKAHDLLSRQWLGTLDSPTVKRITDTCAILRSALAETDETASASLEAQETITLSGVVHYLARFLTKRNETMATFTLDGKKVVVFPKSWAMYKRAILASWDDMAKPNLSCIVKPDDSHGEMEYILQSVEGVEPDALPHSEESESAE